MRQGPPLTTQAELIAATLLLGTPAPATPTGWLGGDDPLVERMVSGPERLHRHTARLAVARARVLTPLGRVRLLTQALIKLERGRPVMRDPGTSPWLQALIDPDLLAAEAVRRSLPTHALTPERCNWPTVLPQARNPFTVLGSRPLADTHVHLGGAVPIAVSWMTLLLSPADAPITADPSWDERLASARAALAALLPTPPSARSGGAPSWTPRDQLLHFWSSCLDADCDAARIATWRLCGSHTLALLGPERVLLVSALNALPATEETSHTPSPLWTWLQHRVAFRHALLFAPGERGLQRYVHAHHGQRALRSRAVDGAAEARLEVIVPLEAALADVMGTLHPPLSARDRGSPVPHVHPDDDDDVTPSPEEHSCPPLTLEYRVQMPDAWRFGQWMLGVAEVLKAWDDPPLAIGFVHHTLRGRRGRSAEEDAQRVLDLLTERTWLRPFLVGLDAAGDELAASPRDFSAWRRIRAQADSALREERSLHLGFTFHCGEDWVELMGALRRLHEAATLLGMEAGDRLGHAVAMQVEPHQVALGTTTLGDHLLDLAWLLQLLDGHPLRARVEERLWGVLAAAGVPSPQRTADELRVAMLQPDLTEAEILDPCKFLWSDSLVDLQEITSWWTDAAVEAQRRVRAVIRHKGLIIETNPTSNLLIGAFGSYDRLPIPCLSAPAEVPFSINSDDPGMFGTGLLQEFIRLGHGRVRAGWTAREALDWLDRARQIGVDSTFCGPTPLRGRALRRYIKRHTAR